MNLMNFARSISSLPRLVRWVVVLILLPLPCSWAVDEPNRDLQKLSASSQNWPFVQESVDGLSRNGYRLLGRHDFDYFGLSIYRAALWVSNRAPSSATLDWRDQECLLSLEYRMSFTKDVLAKRSVEEMTRQRELTALEREKWLAALLSVMVDVKPGDRLTAQFIPPTQSLKEASPQTSTLAQSPTPKPTSPMASGVETPFFGAKTGAHLQLWFQGREQAQAVKLPDITDPELANLFMGIWLSAKTSQPKMREALLGIAPNKSQAQSNQWAHE